MAGSSRGHVECLFELVYQQPRFRIQVSHNTAALSAIEISLPKMSKASIARLTDFRADRVGGQTAYAMVKLYIVEAAFQRLLYASYQPASVSCLVKSW